MLKLIERFSPVPSLSRLGRWGEDGGRFALGSLGAPWRKGSAVRKGGVSTGTGGRGGRQRGTGLEGKG